ncbi:hypothetical protein OXPF_33500 [Oxobacter pfennigii]|uniref:Lipoprotein n=1 Tax=Oxobacter pfennigii TaxID=36849 RepID=A0A0P8YTT0_9CLOT|nr:hypothetical protein [Oxobacter pfennigii]KPU43100.1 hypothetical protein OXPF_33500 [Oxobacter pfennigii]
MRKIFILSLIALTAFLLCSCRVEQWKSAIFKKPTESELISASRIVFTNNKEKALKFTVADPKVISQIASILSNRKEVNLYPGIEADYTINVYLANGGERIYEYWMGALEYKKEVNLKGEGDVYYNIPESLDLYILNSTKMYLRPNNFVSLYTQVISQCISMLDKNSVGDTTVGVDIKSDRRMRRFTMSYEEEPLFAGIEAAGYKIEAFKEESEYDYTLSFVTNTYNPKKASITVEAIKNPDQINRTFIAEAILENNSTWTIQKLEETN